MRGVTAGDVACAGAHRWDHKVADRNSSSNVTHGGGRRPRAAHSSDGDESIEGCYPIMCSNYWG